MNVGVSCYIRQIRDGLSYSGSVKIGGAVFDFELEFTHPIPQLSEAQDPETANEPYRLSIKKDGQEVLLDDEEHVFFLTVVGDLAITFYLMTQTRASNLGETGETEISLSTSSRCSASETIVTKLSHPKFGCVFAI